MMICRICHGSNIKAVWQAREMMHGLRDRFEYFECAVCGCVQIADWPADLARYYPRDYYSLQAASGGKRIAKELELLAAALGLESLAARLGLAKRRLAQDFIPKDLPRRTRVLDVGAGAGGHLTQLYRSGFHRVHGIDPNLDRDNERHFPFRLERASTETLVARGERYGFVYLSHSLEHMPDQQHALRQVRALLEPNGTCCIRIPWVSSQAFETYRTDWIQFDAPRHYYLHSRQSFELLARQTGFRIAKLWCDSSAFQFWGSEQYRRDIPLYSERSWLVAPQRSMFSPAQIEDFEEQARALNRTERGDQIVAWLVPQS
jgi:SAM-dependent methyltransferase